MDAAALAHALGAKQSGRQWKCRCVAHQDREPSMIIFDGRESVQVRCLAGCGQGELIAELRRRGLWERQLHLNCNSIAIQNPRPGTVSHESNLDRARALFDASTLAIGTPAQAYLEDREIWSVARTIEDIRFHPACPRGQELRPAIVVAMRSASWLRSIQAVQRIYLARLAPGRWIKDGKPMMLGPAGGSAMQLGPLGSVLHIAEGLESALSVGAMDHSPVWALGSCGAIERFAVKDGVDRLVIWADHDGPGLKAAETCALRWVDAGKMVDVFRSRVPGEDAADIWRQRCGRS